ncbi:hypothetical protein [Thalassoroseus pseudoceratinae]|uniref:hypothetical protein n=1 Tax=Thalassoroseus pseudoceratinae TaxID=2713176 RepID=UPI0014200C71|nr:hypothetical protein [Thalassoroseus pseudoceratinae]
MTEIIRREAIATLAGTGALASLLGRPHTAGASTSERNSTVALVEGTLSTTHRKGRQLQGFIETGIRHGHVLCSLVRQDERNPAVQSVFAEPTQHEGRHGVAVKVSFFTEPVGELTVSLLHVQPSNETQVARKVAAID